MGEFRCCLDPLERERLAELESQLADHVRALERVAGPGDESGES